MLRLGMESPLGVGSVKGGVGHWTVAVAAQIEGERSVSYLLMGVGLVDKLALQCWTEDVLRRRLLGGYCLEVRRDCVMGLRVG